ncbi:fatty acid 2-hydroxylase-like isoform X2 [Pomacea canaliculata]|uniref:fatty acid 2-hydroxylase-like isoform X2 n=1 Tax=Pomacea canaliculata TaxID=400727 RepID=UPI000D72BA00|nr:fatty acid 2-hydroxylase-like isoform X2 [Pomacea canaliculata]
MATSSGERERNSCWQAVSCKRSGIDCVYHLYERHRKQNGVAKPTSNSYFSTEDDELIDWSKPILGQVAGLGKHYFTWTHQPVDQPIRLFKSDLLELLSKCPWWLVPLTWIPVSLYLLQRSYLGLSSNTVRWNLLATEIIVTPLIIPALVALGIFLWTFFEYSIHRWIFHLNPPPKSPLLIKMHFVLHGQHHKSPMDNMRLVFPPVPASMFAAAIFGTYLLVLPVSVAQAIFAGTILGYMAYDLIHYYIHHATPHSAYFSSLKRYHVKHHFEKQQLGFGISSKLWDYPFGTLIKDTE